MKPITLIKMFTHYSGIELTDAVLVVKVTTGDNYYENLYSRGIKDPKLYQFIANRKLYSFRVRFDRINNMGIYIYVSNERYIKKGGRSDDRAQQA